MKISCFSNFRCELKVFGVWTFAWTKTSHVKMPPGNYDVFHYIYALHEANEGLIHQENDGHIHQQLKESLVAAPDKIEN